MNLVTISTALKEKGNDAFSKGDYALAIQKYTEGLKKQKDMQVLYTNRAQVSVGQEQQMMTTLSPQQVVDLVI